MKKSGFTIVELLIVIVVIGILAAITIIAYTGIQSKAAIAAIQSDLEGAAKTLAADNVTNGTFPAATPTIANGSPQAANGGQGIKISSGGTYQYVLINGTYCLSESNGNKTYFVTSANNIPTVGTCSTLNGLVGWWPLNGDTNDQSGNGNNGANSGATLITGQNGQANSAYSFDGVASQIVIPSSTSLNPVGAMTLSAWINPASNNASIIKGIVTKDISGTPTNPPYGLQLSTTNAISFTTTNASNSSQAIASNTVANIGSWYLLTGVFDGSTLYLYINGTLYGTTAVQTDIGATSTPLRIGQQKNASGRWFNGTIDDVRVYNRAISASEALALYNAGAQ